MDYVDEQWSPDGESYPWTKTGTHQITADGELMLTSNNSSNSLASLDVGVPAKHTYGFRARIAAYTSSAVTGNKNSLAAKIAINNTRRLMFSIGEDGIYGCTASSTWTKLSGFLAGKEWHDYWFEVDGSVARLLRWQLYLQHQFAGKRQAVRGICGQC